VFSPIQEKAVSMKCHQLICVDVNLTRGGLPTIQQGTKKFKKLLAGLLNGCLEQGLKSPLPGESKFRGFAI
jgi:hypothetical protein